MHQGDYHSCSIALAAGWCAILLRVLVHLYLDNAVTATEYMQYVVDLRT